MVKVTVTKHFVAVTPSCQPHHRVNHPSSSSSDVSQLGTCEFTGENTLGRSLVFSLCFFRVVASGVAEVGSLFPRFRASIGHRTVARGRFAIQTVIKRLRRSERFWKMRFAKCSPNCSKSSVCQKVKKTPVTFTFGALLEYEVSNICIRL